MNKAADYSDRCQWLKRSTNKDSTTGQDVESFTANGYLWCAVEPNAGRDQTDYGSRQKGQDGTIRIRNYPAVSALDRLYRPEWGQTWILDSFYYGDNETVCTAHTYEALDL